MELSVFNIQGKETGSKVQLNDTVFNIEPNEHAIYLDVKSILANQRQGTHKAKERNEISGSTRKIRKQKGSGGARFGSIKNPLFRGGGRVFGPRPRSYSFKVNKKVKDLARKSALSVKAQNGAIIVVDQLNFADHKTKNFVAMMNQFNLTGKRVLLVDVTPSNEVILSSRNVQKTQVLEAVSINSYDVMKANTIIVSMNAVSTIEQQLH
jgi:large subunit ribosomal protein L4